MTERQLEHAVINGQEGLGGAIPGGFGDLPEGGIDLRRADLGKCERPHGGAFRQDVGVGLRPVDAL